MAWQSTTVTLRATNQADAVTTPYRDIDIECLVAATWLIDDASDVIEDVAGYRENAISMRRNYELLVREFTVKASDWDHGNYEILAAALRAKRLYITAVVYNGTTHPRVSRTYAAPGTAVALWGTGVTLPIEVRKIKLDRPADNRNLFSLVLALEDVLPVIGVTIT